MFVLGHMGIGHRLAQPFARGLPMRWLLVGTLLPDLIDKPLYYSLRALEIASPLITGSRTFGHTGLLLLTLTATAWITRSRALAALAIGAATHLLLDNVLDRLIAADPQAVWALLWPAFDGRFPGPPAAGLAAHLAHSFHPIVVGGELLGALLLGLGVAATRKNKSTC